MPVTRLARGTVTDGKATAAVPHLRIAERTARGKAARREVPRSSHITRAHARAGERVAIASYLGNGAKFDRAIPEFSSACADQNERDPQQVVDAVNSG
jgi:Uncharacterized protein conserved in bacteria (DUF2252)